MADTVVYFYNKEAYKSITAATKPEPRAWWNYTIFHESEQYYFVDKQIVRQIVRK